MGDTLNNIALKYGTDKASHTHNYATTYDSILTPYRNTAKSVLEIGVLNSASVKMWKEYFQYAQITGVDINPVCKQYEEDRINIIIGDQSKEETFSSLGELDIIIDDGSHFPSHQIASFEILFPRLKDGGVYIIEDLHAQYIKSFYQNDNANIFDYLNKRVQDINFNGKAKDEWYLGDKQNQFTQMNNTIDLNYYEKTIHSIKYYKSVCVIEKRVEIL